MDVSAGTVTAVVVAVCFAAGLNVYATVLGLGVMARMHWVVLPPGLEMVTDRWVIAASGVLFAGEFVADKIPGVDLVWNALHMFVRIPVAALLAYGASSHLPWGMQVLVTAVGAAIAAAAHGSKLAARVVATASPEPVTNVLLSTGEDGLAIGLSWVAMHHPWIAGGAAAGMTGIGVFGIWWGARRVRAAWGGWRRRWAGERA